MLVCVTDPVKKTESLNTHICYRVRTQIRGAIVSDVERRYNNFKLLTEQLADELPGVIVPPLPDSQAIGRFTPEFVELMGGPSSMLFRKFRELCVRTFMALRRERHKLTLLVEMRASEGLDRRAIARIERTEPLIEKLAGRFGFSRRARSQDRDPQSQAHRNRFSHHDLAPALTGAV